MTTLPAEDLELLDAWRGGSRAAGQVLFERYYDALAWFFRTKAPTAVEDLVQAAFLDVVEARTRLRPNSSFRGFLFTVARRRLADHFSHHAGRAVDFSEVSLHDMDPSPSAVLARTERHAQLLAALRKMPVDQQILLELFYWEGLTAAELGDVVDAPEGTVRTRLRRARADLLACLETGEGRERFLASGAEFELWARDLKVRARTGDSPEP